MKIYFLYFLLISLPVFSQEKLVRDLDGDKIADTVFLDSEQIVCRLSTQKYQPARSAQIEFVGDQNGVRETKNGFELFSSFMRAGQACQFRYNSTIKKIQLIGMSAYEFGNAANDGSGEGSVNLLTNTYVGEWNSYDEKKEKLVKLPVIKQKMTFGTIYLEAFDNKIWDDFLEKSSTSYEKQKAASGY